MSTAFSISRSWLIVASLSVLLSACGGGSGGVVTAPVDPAPAYTGVTAQASVSQANAEDLALAGFGGSRLGAAIGARRMVAKGTATANEGDRPVRQLTQMLKTSMRRMEIPRLARERAKALAPSGAGKVLGRLSNFQISGDSGGDASYSVEINDATGSFSGTVVFHDFTSQGIVISGNADMLGTFDANYQNFSRLTLSFKSLSFKSESMRNSGGTIDLVGSLSWGTDFAAGSEMLTINMVLVDRADARTYWFRNYQIGTSYGTGSLTQTISGRYYSPDYGYLEFSTQTPLVASYGNSWPSQGFLKFSGKLGTWGGLSFLPQKMLIEADADGDGSVDWQTEVATNNLPVGNSPPVADAGSDRTVSQGGSVFLDGSASDDPNGDPLSYSWGFDSCPDNICPGLTGSNTATPSFIADRPGTYLLHLTAYDGQSVSPPDTVTVTSTPVAPSDPALLQLQWQSGTFGSSIGQAGLLTSDLDGDGTPEIIASASGGGFGANTFWYVLRRTTDGGYNQIWRSENYAASIGRMALADLNGDGKDDIFVGLTDGTIHIYDGATLQKTGTIMTGKPFSTMAVADLDADGKLEIVTSNGIGICVYSAATGALKWSLSNGGGNSIAVGNVDGDAALEIVATTYGGKGYLIDGVTKTIEWEYANGFGAQVALGDLDGDGKQELVGASSWAKVTVFDAARKTPLWEITTAQDIGALLVTDADGDGIPEIVYGDGQWGKIHAIDAGTHLQKWSVSNPEHGVSGIALADVDHDGKKEVLWGAGGTSSGADHLYVTDPATGTIKWQSQDFSGLNAVAVGDVDGDGQDEIVMVSQNSNSGYAAGIIFIFNARTHALKGQKTLGSMDWMDVRSVAIGDVDGDGNAEIVVTGSNLYDGLIQVYDGKTSALKRESAKYGSGFFSALAIGDPDNDGKNEIVTSSGGNLIVFDGSTMQEKWRSVQMGSSIYDIKLADLDGDGHTDIVATVPGSRLIVYDGVNHDLKLLLDHPARVLETADIDGDGTREILVGRGDGKIDVFDGRTFALKKIVSTFGTASVEALRVADLDGNGTGEWLVASGGVLTVLEGEGQGLKWRSRYLSGNLGLRNHLAVRDADGDGRNEIFLGSDLVLYHFK